MPGTIQVTVLEFKSASSSSQPSAKYLKVSMGKRCYQTGDEGDFSFPITKLGEDLVVTMLDAEGNGIAHKVIRTMQIIEESYWDEVFSLVGEGGGGGHVHMKLQFLLNDEERKRIRAVRESVIKMKREIVSNANIGLSESAASVETFRQLEMEQKISDSHSRIDEIDLISPTVEALQNSPPLNSTATSTDLVNNEPEDERSIVESSIPNATDEDQSASSPPVNYGAKTEPSEILYKLPFSDTRSDFGERASSVLSESVVPDKHISLKFEGDPVLESRKQSPAMKIPSNVRKMISAFENTQPQGMVKPDSKKEVIQSLRKASSVPSQLNRVGIWEPTHKQSSERRLREDNDQYLSENTVSVSGRSEALRINVESSQEIDWSLKSSPSRGESLIVEDISEETSREKLVKEWEILPAHLMRQTSSENVTPSGKTHEEQSQVATDRRARGQETEPKSSTVTDIQSNQKQKSLEYYEENYYSSESSGMWIFPDNTRQLCITTADAPMTQRSGHQYVGAKTHQDRKILLEDQTVGKSNVMHGGKYKMEQTQPKINKPQESASNGFPENSSNGLIGQVIKIVAIVGFGVLVLLTRQKTPRKKKDTEEKVNLSFIQLSLMEEH